MSVATGQSERGDQPGEALLPARNAPYAQAAIDEALATCYIHSARAWTLQVARCLGWPKARAHSY